MHYGNWTGSDTSRARKLATSGTRVRNGVEAKPVAGTEGILAPYFWSPDSGQIGFLTSDHLKKVRVRGPEGPVQTLAQVRPFASGASGGGSWSPDGTIIFVPGGRG